MDPLTTLYTRLRQRSADTIASRNAPPEEPPRMEDWLRYWNDEDTDLSNLRNFEHWLTRAIPARRP